MTPARDKQRIAALATGLAATITVWTFAAGYAPGTLESLGDYSPWLYGPGATLAWAAFSGLAYLVIRRGNQPIVLQTPIPSYHCRQLGVASPRASVSVCANRREKNHLGAVTAGFALTMTTWVAALSTMPDDWLDTLGAAPAWSYCLATVGLWAALSTTLYTIFAASDRRRQLHRTNPAA